MLKASEGDWKAFEQWLDGLRAGFGNRRLLFRGQASSQWPLETTLERQGQKNISVRYYYQLITARIGPAVETFTGISVPEYDHELEKGFGDLGSFFEGARFPSGALYEYMVY